MQDVKPSARVRPSNARIIRSRKIGCAPALNVWAHRIAQLEQPRAEVLRLRIFGDELLAGRALEGAADQRAGMIESGSKSYDTRMKLPASLLRCGCGVCDRGAGQGRFSVVEATIPQMQAAMAKGQVTSRQLVDSI